MLDKHPTKPLTFQGKSSINDRIFVLMF